MSTIWGFVTQGINPNPNPTLTLTVNLTVGLLLIWKNPSHMTVRMALSKPRIIDTILQHRFSIRVVLHWVRLVLRSVTDQSLSYILADHTACSMIGYWHHNVVCLSVCLVCDAVHCCLVKDTSYSNSVQQQSISDTVRWKTTWRLKLTCPYVSLYEIPKKSILTTLHQRHNIHYRPTTTTINIH